MLHIILIKTFNVSILLAWLSAAGKEVVLYLVARNTFKNKKNLPPQANI
jgi:hypothetical protein